MNKLSFSLKVAAIAASGIIFNSCGGDSNSNNNSWTQVTNAEGGFMISMPGDTKLEKSEKTEVTPFGKQVVHFLTWKPKTFSINKFKLFQVSYTDCPARYLSDTIMQQVMLDSSIRMRARDFTEKAIVAENIELNGYPGRSFIYQIPHDNNLANVKQCFTNNRRYDLIVIARSDEGTNNEVGHFFDSFQALK